MQRETHTDLRLVNWENYTKAGADGDREASGSLTP
jgi:hypothetical protein